MFSKSHQSWWDGFYDTECTTRSILLLVRDATTLFPNPDVELHNFLFKVFWSNSWVHIRWSKNCKPNIIKNCFSAGSLKVALGVVRQTMKKRKKTVCGLKWTRSSHRAICGTRSSMSKGGQKKKCQQKHSYTKCPLSTEGKNKGWTWQGWK